MPLPGFSPAVKVKICGLTNLADAEAAVEAGADLLGFIFYPKSPRYVSPETVQTIVAALRAGGRGDQAPRPFTVGVFVNTPTDEIAAILAQTGLDYAQLHGDEPASALAALNGRGFKALRPTVADLALAQAADYAPYPAPVAPQLLVDGYTAAYGGAGVRADWSIAAQVAAAYPRLLLAGGLDPDTVHLAIGQVRPWGVDVSSGVEASPGRKDPAKLRAFIAAVRDT
ncbi:MAG TPA: phosphoribosylanthranilate isomerase [Caldilineaceae bacterium]|nr:phosphoribosylanthranilate isomerase [Caldilineaceae bacterium]